ncbi:Nuclear import receptor [Nowakowskiella sp. JEL0078]|nr:Nuclear import receptor [Nowakowskiella sp. JEL0078]
MAVLSAKAQEVLVYMQIVTGEAPGQPSHNKILTADKFLQKFRLQKEAWAVYIELINSNFVSDNAGLLCAQAITYKVRHHWSELDPAQRLQLRNTVLAVLRTKRASNFLREIAVCLAVISMFMMEWKNPIFDLMSEFGSNADLHVVLLEYLTVFSEESYLTLSDSRHGSSMLNYAELREIEVERLEKNAPTVLQFLHFLVTGGEESQRKIMNCLASWLKQGHLKLADIIDSPLLSLPFQLMCPDENDCFNAAYEIITISEIRSNAKKEQSPEITQINIATAMKVYSLVIQLQPLISKNIDDPEFIGFICELLVHFGCSHMDLLLREFSSFHILIETLLECMKLNDPNILLRTFLIWNTMDKYIYEDLSVTPREYSTITPHLLPLFTRIFNILIPLLRYPEAADNWTPKELDDFRDLRHEVGDMLKICVTHLGAKVALQRPYEILQQVVAAQQQGRAMDWRDVEAVLFAIRTMARVIRDDESDVLPLVMSLLPHLPDHPKIRYAAILVIGRYTKWSAYKENKQFIPQQLAFVFTGFSDKEIVPAAAQALRHLADDCGEYMIPYLSELYTNYATLMSVLENERIEFISSIAFIVARLPPAELTEALTHFCVPLAQTLVDICARGPGENPRATLKEIEETLEYLIEYLKILRLPSDFKWTSPQPLYPVAAFIESLWPVLDKIMSQFPSVAGVASQVAREAITNFPHMLWRFAVTNIVPRLVSLCETAPSGQLLRLARSVVREFRKAGRSEDAAGLVVMVEQLSDVVFKAIEAGLSRDKKYDLLSDYFYLLGAAFDEMPDQFSRSSYLPTMIQFTYTYIPADNYIEGNDIEYAINGAVYFLEDLLSSTRPDVRAIIKPLGPHIIAALFRAMTTDMWVELRRIRQAAGIVQSLDRLDSETTRKAIVDVVASVDEDAFPGDAKQMLLDKIAGAIGLEKENPMAGFLLRYFVVPYRRANGNGLILFFGKCVEEKGEEEVMELRALRALVVQLRRDIAAGYREIQDLKAANAKLTWERDATLNKT